ncbi:MAG: FAD-dependent thymidylate synthase [Candidatus Micrarchaeota archaeon]
MSEEFSGEERKQLAPFVSNFDKGIFVLRNLPEVVKGALFSRYSRSTKSLRRTLLDEFIKSDIGFTDIMEGQAKAGDSIATEKAEKFYDRVLVQYGDDSVAELAGAHIALEDISIIATKLVEDARLGLSPLEKSTRYVYFDQKVDGKYRFCREQTLMKSEFAEEYERTCNMLFDTYASLIPKVSEYVKRKMPRDETISERVYEATVRSKTCDILRGLLPASTLTNMGFFGNGRSYEYLITKLYAEPLSEMKDIAASMQQELRTVIPSFVKRPDSEHGKDMQEYFSGVRDDMENIASTLGHESANSDVTLVDYDPGAEDKILVSALYPYSGLTMRKLREKVSGMGANEKAGILKAYIGKRKNRRHKPGRAFEEVYYTFEICTNFGAYRDLHRHRVLTQQRQLLGCALGATVPHEIIESGHVDVFVDVMESAKRAWERIAAKYPKEAQYVVPLAYNIRWEIKLNLREAFHFCELRSARQGHIDYRIIAQKMHEEIKKVHPSLADGMKYMDMGSYEFERLEAEKRIERKIEELEKKHGG